MKKKQREELLHDFDMILDISFKYCKYEGNEKVRVAAIKINDEAYKTMKYVDRYLKVKKKKKTKK